MGPILAWAAFQLGVIVLGLVWLVSVRREIRPSPATAIGDGMGGLTVFRAVFEDNHICFKVRPLLIWMRRDERVPYSDIKFFYREPARYVELWLGTKNQYRLPDLVTLSSWQPLGGIRVDDMQQRLTSKGVTMLDGPMHQYERQDLDDGIIRFP